MDSKIYGLLEVLTGSLKILFYVIIVISLVVINVGGE